MVVQQPLVKVVKQLTKYKIHKKGQCFCVVSEPHTSELNSGFSLIYVCIVRTSCVVLYVFEGVIQRNTRGLHADDKIFIQLSSQLPPE